MAFQILSGKGWKTWSTASNSCSPKQSGIQSLAAICAKNRGEKHHRAFVEVVEDSEIYNFAIYPSVHFSSSFGSKSWSKSPAPQHFMPERVTSRVPLRLALQRATRVVCAIRRRTWTPRRARDPRSVRHTLGTPPLPRTEPSLARPAAPPCPLASRELPTRAPTEAAVPRRDSLP
jgi:hypothetical protein